jgi:hypothetical protein
MADAIQLSGSFSPSSSAREPSAGVGPVKLGDNFSARSILDSVRYKELSFKSSYFKCSQHDGKTFDFEGRATKAGPPTSMPYLSQEKSAAYVPLSLRKPSSPYRLPKLMVNAFTALLIGEQRWPRVETPGDDAAADFANALDKAAALQARFIQARGEGGSCGTVGFSWSFHLGRPRVNVHSAKHLFVHRWADRELLVPAEVSEVYRYPKDEWDGEKGAFIRNYYWHHRYWDEQLDVTMLPVRFDPKVEPVWVPDEEHSDRHDNGFCPFVWCQNLPSDEVDGEADYDGLYENFDTLDVLNSVLTKGCVLNLDPTLVLQVAPVLVKMGSVKKGSENALTVGEGGDAHYMELAGTSIEAGLKFFEQQKQNVLDVGQCVLTDPNEVAAQGISSVALKVIYSAMTAKCDVLREQYGEAKRRLISQMMTVARRKMADGTGQFLYLPPRVVQGKVDPTPRSPGASSDYENVWGPYFQTTPDDRQKGLASLGAAAGNTAVIAKQTAVEDAAVVLGKDPEEEWRRYSQEQAQQRAEKASLFEDADAGGRQVQATVDPTDGVAVVVAGSAGAPGKGGAPGGGGDASGAGGSFSEAGP